MAFLNKSSEYTDAHCSMQKTIDITHLGSVSVSNKDQTAV
jgi:hypothetical protein